MLSCSVAEVSWDATVIEMAKNISNAGIEVDRNGLEVGVSGLNAKTDTLGQKFEFL